MCSVWVLWTLNTFIVILGYGKLYIYILVQLAEIIWFLSQLVSLSYINMSKITFFFSKYFFHYVVVNFYPVESKRCFLKWDGSVTEVIWYQRKSYLYLGEIETLYWIRPRRYLVSSTDSLAELVTWRILYEVS